ncbi:MAG: TonB-dependent receptor [Caldithrix sp.]|nr:TonB-dependent receptor [Caldithrix sp.]
MSRKIFYHSCMILGLLVYFFFAQDALAEQDTVRYELEPIHVTGLRYTAEQMNVPFSIASIDGSTIQEGRMQLSLKESLDRMPGIFVQNATNFAQDLRISIRGFGAQSAFGIRGVQVLVDGIPITTPDGQTQLDQLNLATVQSMEVLRGPVSTLYGNASAGVISITTKPRAKHSYAQSRVTAGSYGFRQAQVNAGVNLNNAHYYFTAVSYQSNGYRQNSAMQSHLFNTGMRFNADSLSEWMVNLRMQFSPIAEDAGGLTREQLEDDPAQAYEGNIRFDTGESVQQGQLSVTYRRNLSDSKKVRASAHVTRRIFANRLPFTAGGMVNLDRDYGGFSVVHSGWQTPLPFPNALLVGLDVRHQNDHRQRYNNDYGAKGHLAFDQDELYTNAAAFMQNRFTMWNRLTGIVGARYDWVTIKAKDHFAKDGDQSGKRYMYGWSAMAGIVWPINSWVNGFTNLSSGFENPALIELTNNPDGQGGFNDNLKARQALNMEAGVKGIWQNRLRYSIALYNIEVRQDFVPFERAQSPGRIYFRNAGSARHRGLEIGFDGLLLSGVTVTSAYTYADLRHLEYNTDMKNLSGNRLAGVPRHRFFSALTYRHPSGGFLRAQWKYRGTLYADDANTVRDEGYTVLNVQMGYPFRFLHWKVQPFAGFNNLLNADYPDNVRINAFGKRYFEPAPPFNLYGGLSLKRIF